MPVLAAGFKRMSNTGMRQQLHEQNPHCHWCDRLTVLYRPKLHQKPMGGMATVDHIKDRLQCASKQEHRAKENMVLACYACNKRRAEAEDEKRTAHLRQLVQWMK